MPYRLNEPGLGVLNLTPANGYAVREIDLGRPRIREVVEDVVNGNGTDDATRYFGARAVTLTMQTFSVPGRSRFQVLQKLSAYCSPRRRPYLEFDPDNTGVWYRILLRGTDLGSPITRPGFSETSVGWSGPEGIYESLAETTKVLAAGDSGKYGGVTFSLTMPVTFAASIADDTLAVVNPGNEEALGIYRLWGPCTGPILEDVRTGRRISFPTATLSDGQYIEVNTRTSTLRLNGREAESMLPLYDSLNSTLFKIAPADANGPARLRYVPTTFGTGARAEIVFRAAYT